MPTPLADSSGYAMQKVKSGITQKELQEWGGGDVFNQALAIVNSGDITEFAYDDETLTISGKITQPSGFDMPVSLVLKPGGRIESKCPCITNQKYGMVCPHVVALGIAVMVSEMDDEEADDSSAPSTRKEAEEKTDEEEDFIDVPMRPRFSAYVCGSKASLSIEVDAVYGDIDIPACSLQSPRLISLPDPDDPLVRRVRSIETEREAVKSLAEWGFEPGYRKNDVRHYLTDPKGVLDFLGSGLPELRRRGWHIDLEDRLMALTDKMPSVVPVVTVKDAGNDFDVNISFDAMGTDVSPVEIQAAVNRGDGYLMRNGETILIDRSAIDSIRSVFSDCATSQNGAERGWFRVKGVYSPYVRSALESLDAVDLDDSAAANWRERSKERTCAGGDAKYEPVSIGRLDGILRPYQKQGVYWMRFLENSGYSGLLADEMGLGKTLQTLAWLSLPRAAPGGRRNGRNLPALIVCPTSLVRNWEAEAEKFVPELRTLVVSGADRAANFSKIDNADLVITSYALVQRDFEEAYLEREFSAIVLDEAQHIKNRQTKNAQTVKMLRSAARLVLTGTPVENSVADVWSIFDFSMPGYLGFYDDFKAGYEEPIADGGSAAQAATERLKRKLAPFILRRLKKTVAKDLPDKIVKISYCPMSEDAEREYTAALASSRREAGGLIRSKGFAKSKFELLALLMKLRRIASRAKIEPFMEQLASAVEGGHKILVFSQFVKTLAELKEKLTEAGIPFCYLDGSTKDRLGECNRFNRTPEIPVFLISLMAGGTGLNLTGADMVMHYDPWWNPAVEDQATDRAHRIGQKKTVYVIKMIASDSIEEKVLKLQRRKQAVINATVGTTDAAVMESLSAADIAELLS